MTSKRNILLFISASVVAAIGWTLVPSQSAHILTEFSISYRFFIGFFLLFILSKFKGYVKPLSLKEHATLLISGILMYSVFCSFAYRATLYLPIGMVALFVSLILIPTTLLQRIFYKTKISRNFLICLVLTVIGCVVIYSRDFSLSRQDEYYGTFLIIVAITLYSLGNLVSLKIPHEKVSKIYQASLAMLYGATASLIAGFTMSGSLQLQFDFSTTYIISLLLLSVVLSPILLVAIFYLNEKIGPTPTSYIWVLMSILALVISISLGDMELTPELIIGTILIILGLYITKTRKYLRQDET